MAVAEQTALSDDPNRTNIEIPEEEEAKDDLGYEVHPVAAMFPMMTDDELDDLAEDIKANGLVHPIVLDADGKLIDGRNRLTACRRAEVEPAFTTLNGQDPVAFIISCNVTRRHLSKGQQAMAVARAQCFLKKQSLRSVAGDGGVSYAQVSYAKTVIEYAPDLADAVLSGATPLNDAYNEARQRKQAAETEESRFARLRIGAPDLAAMVQEERLTLAEGLGAMNEREAEARRKEEDARRDREQLSSRFHAMLTALDRPEKMDPDEWAASWLDADPSLVGENADFSAERAERAADTLLRYASLKKERDNG